MRLPKGLTEAKLAELRRRVVNHIAYSKPTHIIGVDEVGYGACAGPLVLGGVYVPVDWKAPEGLTDSKMLTEAQVERLANGFGKEVELATGRGDAVFWQLRWCSNDVIDQKGLGKVRKVTVREIVEVLIERCKSLGGKPLAFVDGDMDIEDAVSLPKADFVVPAVSMAAVMAKHARDVYMRSEMEARYPGYGFRNHVGYDVPEHRAALQKLGSCAIHRKSNATVAKVLPSLVHPLTAMVLNGEFDD